MLLIRSFNFSGSAGCYILKLFTEVQWWECIMTFTLISCVYACGVAKPGHGSHTPLVVGLALFCCAASGGQYTGGALNPARVLGPLTVFGCGEDIVSWRMIETKRFDEGNEVTSEVDQNLMNILHPSVGSLLRSPIFPPCACNTSLSRYSDTISSFFQEA